jgi:1,4-dihydroxy-6-naphthoate synthase
VTIPLALGYSPCPNDTLLFYALAHGRVDTEGLEFHPRLADVETLNQSALAGELAMTKVSYGVLGRLCARYWCLGSGGALGRGCGPLVVARRESPLEPLLAGKVAVPGRHTTANLLLGLRAGRPVRTVPMVFHEILPAVASGVVDAGVIIHESRFTYAARGLVAVADLGQWWEEVSGLPIPLGGIVLRRGLPGVDPGVVQRVLRRSVAYAFEHPDEPMGYVRTHAQELDEAVMRDHIGLYVNQFSLELGDEGRRAVEELLARSAAAGLSPPWAGPLFPG